MAKKDTGKISHNNNILFICILGIWASSGSPAAADFYDDSFEVQVTTDLALVNSGAGEKGESQICEFQHSVAPIREPIPVDVGEQTPTPAEKAIWSIGRAMEDKKVEQAQKLAREIVSDTPEAHFVLARVAAASGDHDAAVNHYKNLKMPNMELEVIRITELVDVLAAAKQYQQVVAVVDQWLAEVKRPPDTTVAQLLEKKAIALINQGDPALAIPVYNKILKQTQASKKFQRLRLELGKLFIDIGRPFRAKGILEPLAMNANRSWLMRDAYEALEKASLAPKYTGRDSMRRAMTFKDFRAWKLGLEALEPALASDNLTVAMEARLLEAKLLMRLPGGTEQALEKLQSFGKNSKFYRTRVQLLEAEGLSKLNRDDEAVDIYLKLAAAAVPKPELAMKLYYKAARLDYFLSNYDRALKTCILLLKDYKRKLSTNMHKETLFTAGMSALQLNDTWVAAGYFFEAAKGTKEKLGRTRYIYWRAVALQQARPDFATKLFHHICKLDPSIWYAQLSYQRLEEEGKDAGPCSLGTLPQGKPFEVDKKPLYMISPSAAFLKRTGFYREAAEYLRKSQRAGRAKASYRALMTHYVELEAPQHVVLAAGHKLPWPPNEEYVYRATIAYPRPYGAVVRETEKKHNLPEDAVYAIARKESLFNPNVVSYAGAMGLMQFMPRTYERNRKRAGLPKLKEGELPGPVESIVAAGYELENLMNKFGALLPLAFMAYNGGEGAVTRWIERSGDSPTDLFVEKCGFTQTRNYVRRVYQNLARYRQLSGKDRPVIPKRVDKSAASSKSQ